MGIFWGGGKWSIQTGAGFLCPVSVTLQTGTPHVPPNSKLSNMEWGMKGRDLAPWNEKKVSIGSSGTFLKLSYKFLKWFNSCILIYHDSKWLMLLKKSRQYFLFCTMTMLGEFFPQIFGFCSNFREMAVCVYEWSMLKELSFSTVLC